MMEEDRINAITCTTWVPQGAANESPEKVEITKEDLAKIIAETSENLIELENTEDDDYTALEVEALEEDLKIVSLKPKPTLKNDVEMEDKSEENKDKSRELNEEEDVEKLCNLETYDNEKEVDDTMLNLGKLVVHADSEDDPNILVKEDDDESEKENQKILPTDNLIAVGHVDGDAAILEVYVYNSEEGSLYVHHDILLSSVPLCMEWLNYDPEEEKEKPVKPSNLVAIGSMSSIIEIWDLDLIDCLEPAYVLGRIPKKKKKLSRIGHSDAVLSLSWNKDLHHLLASGSVDKSIILWDLEECREAQKINKFGDKVQSVLWHPKENHYLLGGSCDKTVKLFDCMTENTCKSWSVDGEVEIVSWDPAQDRGNYCCAGTDAGSVYCFDIRQNKPLQHIQAHEKSCSGMILNEDIPGCLITASEDETVKIWDLMHTKAKLVETRNPKIGVIHSVSCSPNSNFVISLGGDNKVNNFKVWDIRQSKKVRKEFCDRLRLPIEDEEEEDDPDVVIEDEEENEEDYFAEALADNDDKENASNWKPKKKSKKKKGGHLDKRNK